METTTKDSIQEQALAAIGNNKTSGVVISMGVGKTKLGLMWINKNYNDNINVLIVVPKKSIMTSWVDDMRKFGLDYLLPHVKFTTYLSLNKHQVGDYDLLILDECHSLKLNHSNFLLSYKISGNKILGLTGTKPRNDKSEKGIMIQEFCPIVYTYKIDAAIEDKILNDYIIIVHMLEMDTKKTMKVEKNGKVWMTSERATYDYWTGRIDNAKSGKELQIMRVMRMKAMMDFPSKEKLAVKLFKESTNKILLFTNTQAQVDKMCTHSCHSKNPDSDANLEKFKSGEITKLSAVQQLSEGVNIPDLKEAIIMHSFSGNSPKSSQKLGRLLRLSTNQVATLHILCYEDSADATWVSTVLENFDKNKITVKNFIP